LNRCRFWTASVSVLLAVLTGCACGLFNGFVVSVLRVVPFIVTLGTMMIYLGLAKMIASETTVRPAMNSVPDWLQSFTSLLQKALWFGLPVGVWLTLVLAIGLAAILRYSVFGRYVFALGSNESTARLCGINITRTKILVYTFAGLFVGMAGLYQFSRLSVGNPTSGSGLELKIIAAVVIGGASLSGGRGSVLGTLSGAAIMAVITSGCTLLELKNPIQDVILGVIIIAAVFVDQMRQRRLAG
jgi:ribose transport system permease protein